MKITVGIQNMVLYPENDAEVFQLEWVVKEMKQCGRECNEIRHWNIVALKIPLSPKEKP